MMNTRINNETVVKNRALNLLSTLALLGGMVSLLSLLGWALAGFSGMAWAFLISVILLVVSPHLSPQFVMRMFGARPLSPDQAPSLYSVLQRLAQRAKLTRLPQLYYVPTPVTNAFATGSRDNAGIGITDGLLKNLNRRELTAVLAHEISHLQNNDLWIQNLSNTIGKVTSFFLMVGQILLFLNLPLVFFYGKHISWLFILVLMAAPFISMMLQLALSRKREFNADLSAAVLTGDPHGLASALSKIDQHQNRWPMGIFWPGRGKRQPDMLRTHPKTEERIKRLQSLTDDKRVYQHPAFPFENKAHDYFERSIPVRIRPGWRRYGAWGAY